MRAEPFTLLSLFDYAKILGLDPLHFAGGYSDLRPSPTCRDVWFQYDWQDPDLVSRHQLAILIHDAEQDIADALGYWPGPVWIEDERHRYSQLYRRDLTGYGQDVRFRYRHLRTNYGYVIEGGQRATTQIGDDVAFTTIDADDDGFNEIARFVLADAPATVDPCEVHMYYKPYELLDIENTRTDPVSTGADPAWEIRPIRATRETGVLNVYCYVWQLFSPTLFEMLGPTVDGHCQPIDADAAASYVDGVDFYRVYNGPGSPAPAIFGWASDRTCADVEPCDFDTQTGCLRIDDNRNGLVVPTPATYNAATGTFTAACGWTNVYEPDIVRLWYRAGFVDPHAACESLSSYWAYVIAMLATARSDWPICSCSDTNNPILSPEWREDISRSTSEKFHVADSKTLNNPFGTRKGEVEAWRRVARNRGRAKGQAVIT